MFTGLDSQLVASAYCIIQLPINLVETKVNAQCLALQPFVYTKLFVQQYMVWTLLLSSGAYYLQLSTFISGLYFSWEHLCDAFLYIKLLSKLFALVIVGPGFFGMKFISLVKVIDVNLLTLADTLPLEFLNLIELKCLLLSSLVFDDSRSRGTVHFLVNMLPLEIYSTSPCIDILQHCLLYSFVYNVRNPELLLMSADASH